MKKIFTLIMAVFLIMSCQDENNSSDFIDRNDKYLITQLQAESIAKKIIQGETNSSETILNLNTIYGQNQAPAIYVFNAKKQNKDYFVLISGDKRTEDVVLGFGKDKIDLEEAPEQLKFWLSKYEKLINHFRKTSIEDVKKLNTFEKKVAQIVSKYNLLENTTEFKKHQKSSYVYTMPFVTTRWNQGCVYNTYSPEQNSSPSLSNCEKTLPCGKAYTGCVSTCLSQVVNYYESMSGYNYSLLYDTYDDSYLGTPAGNEVGKLMKRVADIMRMNYTCTGSGAYASYYLPRFSTSSALGFKEILKRYYFNGTNDQLFSAIKNEIETNNIVVFSGQDTVARAGHLWLADGGYFTDSLTGGTSYLHFNWGWGGKADGWFAYADFNSGKYNFNSGTTAFYNFRK